MSFQSKRIQLMNSVKYRSLQSFKFYFLKYFYRKKRTKAINLLNHEQNLIIVDNNFLKNKYENEFAECLSIKEETNIKFKKLSKKIDLKMHGVKYPELLYIILKYTKPTKVLECGVWLGLSSNFILAAGITYDTKFKLHSTDLPRFDLKNSDNLIGYLVNTKFKNNWELFVGKDRKLIPKLIQDNKYNFYYFDSDKSVSGKLFQLNQVLLNTEDYIVLFDDIEDSLFWFRKEVSKLNKVLLRYEEKYFGIIFSDGYQQIIEGLFNE